MRECKVKSSFRSQQDTHVVLQMDEELFSRELGGSTVAALVEVPPVAPLLLLAQAPVKVKLSPTVGQNATAPVLVLDPWSEAKRADSAGRLVLQVVPVLRHVLVESPRTRIQH